MFPTTDTLTTSLGDLPIRRASAGDADAVHAVMCDAAAWLARKQIKQWVSVPSKGFREFLDHRIANHAVYLLDYVGQPIATICLCDADPDIWGPRGDDGLAGYIHGFAVRDSVRRHQIGRSMLAWAEDCFAAAGRSLFRLDTMAENNRLCEYYCDLGFIEIETRKMGPFLTRLYERPIKLAKKDAL